jgi:branched-chain amino acid transport system permease protein
VLLGAPTLKLRGDYLAIVTLGFGEIVRIFLNNLSRPFNLTNLCQLSDWSTNIAERCASDPNLTLFGSNYQDVFAFFVLIAVLVFRPSGLLGERISDRA